MSFQRTPKVAIVGRPNVGKSSLFNKLSRTRKAVVRNEPGVTRDILIEPAAWWGREFDIVDTGGLTEAKDDFSPLIWSQVTEILKSVDLLVLVMDGRSGLMPEDREVFRVAKESGKPTLVVVNKVDNTLDPEPVLLEFYEFGETLIPAAFESDFGIDNIVEWILSHLTESESSHREGIRIALVGKPNVGKSSLCNRFLGMKRMLVSPIAGTTVDAVEESFEFENEAFILVDTAGMRKAARRKEGVERLSAVKSKGAIDRADIVLLVIDAVEGPTNQDARVMEYAMERHKAIFVVANKADLAKEEREAFKDWFRAAIEREFHFFPDVQMAFVSALTGFGINELLRKVSETHKKLHVRIPTSHLNKFFTEVIRQAPSPVWGTTDVKFYYLTQTHQVPPSFIAFANHPDGVTPAYRRFLSKRIQERWDLQGIPIRIFVMPSRKNKKRKFPPSQKHTQFAASTEEDMEFDMEMMEE